MHATNSRFMKALWENERFKIQVDKDKESKNRPPYLFHAFVFAS